VSVHVTNIIFSAPMIRALLAGRKTQTRRLCSGKGEKRTKWASLEAGTLIYVRETCRAVERSDGVDGVLYEADEQWFPIANTAEAADRWVDLYHYRGTRGAKVNAIHMPRWASRITLELTGVPKIERLQDISEADAKAEGVEPSVAGQDAIGPVKTYRTGFVRIWRELHGDGAWAANPEVAVLYFWVHLCNVDQMPTREAA
jgi:hypothetical protein